VIEYSARPPKSQLSRTLPPAMFSSCRFWPSMERGLSLSMPSIRSSLMVYSGFRFAEAAAAAGKPIAAVNLGRTRADHLLALKIGEPCEEALTEAISA